MSDLEQVAGELRQHAALLQAQADKLTEAASILDGLPGGAPLEATPAVQIEGGLKSSWATELESKLSASQAANSKLRDEKAAWQRREVGLEARLKRQTDHISALEQQLQEIDGSDRTRIATLQQECAKLREKVTAAKNEQFSVQEDLNAAKGHIQELEALLEGATMPEGAGTVPIGDLMPKGEPITTVTLRNGGGGQNRVQAVMTFPRGVEAIREYTDERMGQKYALYLRDGAIVLRPLEQVEPYPPDTPEEAAKARENGQTQSLPAPTAEPPLPAEEPASPPQRFGRKPAVKLTLEQFRDWARGAGEFTRKQAARELNVSDPTVKNQLTAGLEAGFIVETSPAILAGGTGGGRIAAKYSYAKPVDAGAAAKVDQQRPKQPVDDYVKPKRGKTVAGTGKQFKGSGNPDVRALINSAKAAGATVSPTSGGHIAVTFASDGQNKRVLISNTPRDPRTVLNDKGRLRKAGLDV